jgi:hypothetical protein
VRPSGSSSACGGLKRPNGAAAPTTPTNLQCAQRLCYTLWQLRKLDQRFNCKLLQATSAVRLLLLQLPLPQLFCLLLLLLLVL